MNASRVYYFISENVLLEYSKGIATIMPVIVIFGILSNLLSAIAFLKMGLSDSMTLSFMALTLSDLSHLLISFVQVVCLALYYFTNAADAVNLFLILYWYAYMFYDASTFITTYIAVVRCCCVAMPLRFKSVVTQHRTKLALSALVLLGVVLRLPMVALMELVGVVNPVTNKSELIIRTNGDMSTANIFNDTVNRNAIPWLCFSIVAVCMLILGAKLHRASKFRRQVSKHLQSLETTQPSSSLSAKDIKVIESVALVSAMFVLFNLPFILYSLTRMVYPPFSTQGPYSRLFTVVATLSQAWGYLGMSVNAFIYYKYNSKYRKCVQSFMAVVYVKM